MCGGIGQRTERRSQDESGGRSFSLRQFLGQSNGHATTERFAEEHDAARFDLFGLGRESPDGSRIACESLFGRLAGAVAVASVVKDQDVRSDIRKDFHFQLPVAGADEPRYCEPVYCDELYHRWRYRWPENFSLSLNGKGYGV